MSDVLIKCEGVSKKFCKDLKKSLWYGLKGLAAEAVGRDRHHETLREGEFWASKDISFEVKRGECLGLIGHNGAGKTTLLKMLNGLIRPDKGRIEMRGQIGAMIALGAGFNPILTGRENIYIAGSLRGMSKRQIDAKLDEIIAFAEMEEFIDMPVQSYSSGMQVRLGFAAAVNMEPDVLLIDEVLAVGDIAFRLKCYNAIAKIVNDAAVIFVSHSMPQVAKLCTRGIVLNHGSIRLAAQDIAEAIHEYNNLAVFNNVVVGGDGRVAFKRLTIRTPGNSKDKTITLESEDRAFQFEHADDLEIELELEVAPEVKAFGVAYSFSDPEQRFVAQCHTEEPIPNERKPMKIKSSLRQVPFSRGRFSLNLGVVEAGANRGIMMLNIRDFCTFVVTAERTSGTAPIRFVTEWESKPSEE